MTSAKASNPFPIGRVVGHSRASFRITEHLRGEPLAGQYAGVNTTAGAPVLITVGPRLPGPVADAMQTLSLRVNRVGRLMGIFDLEEDGQSLHAMVELMHHKPVSAMQYPLEPADAKRLAALVADTVRIAAGQGLTIGGIRPELTTVHRPHDALKIHTLVPRGEVFLGMAGGHDAAARLFDDRYAAPEVVFGQPATPAADVFSVCALLAHIVTGEYPFVGDRQAVQLTSMRDGRRRPWTGPRALESIVSDGLAADRSRRPSPEKLVEALHASTRSLASKLFGFLGGGDGDPALDAELAPRPAQNPRFPVGEILAGGDYTIGERISGQAWRGRYHGSDRRGKNLLITVTYAQTVRASKLRRQLDLDYPGIARLRYIGQVSAPPGQGAFDGMVEDCPAGQPVSDLAASLDPRQGLALAVEVGQIVAGVARAGETIGGLRPELVYAKLDGDRPSVTGIVPRCERFIVTASRPDMGLPQLFDMAYQAPEVLFDALPMSPATDVFSLSVMCAEWVGGRYPFEGEVLLARLVAAAEGQRVALDLPAELAELIDRSLVRDPQKRPSIEEWLVQARQLLDLPTWKP